MRISTKLTSFFMDRWVAIALFTIILSSFIFRVNNLNYNSPFNDEAIYIVLGKFGVFQGDWWTYNASAWMAGQPYIYPPMTALAYNFGGIVGSRFLNVLFGALTIEAIFALTYVIVEGSKTKKAVSGLIAAVVVAASSVGYYTARLATYDLPSYFFFVLSLLFIVKALKGEGNLGRLYFLGSSLLFFAFMSKVVVAIYIPIIFIYTLFKSYKAGSINFDYWKKYFFSPIVIFTLLYIAINASTLFTYAVSQVAREQSSYAYILQTYWDNTKYAWTLFIAGSLGLFIKRDFSKWSILFFASLIILSFHLALHRWPTLDKHTFMSLIFLAPIIGIGLTNLISFPKHYYGKVLIATLVGLLLEQYVFMSALDSKRFNDLWANNNSALKVLNYVTKPGDKILAEVGADAILANYDKNYPIYTTTFDWFTYKNLEGEKAYQMAIKDGYFDLIELDGGDSTTELVHSRMHNLVLKNVEGGYERIYQSDGFLIYKRAY